MSSYFDLLPDELFVTIIYYLPTLELHENKYIQDKLINKWLLLFTFAFPDIYVNLIENINYSHQDFNYSFLIYKHLTLAYLSLKEQISNNKNVYLNALKELKPDDITYANIADIYADNAIGIEFALYDIHNFNLKYLILTKNQVLMDEFIKKRITSQMYLNIYYDKYQIEAPELEEFDQKIDLSNQEALTLAVYLEYNNNPWLG